MTKTMITLLLTTGFSAFAQGSTTETAALPATTSMDVIHGSQVETKVFRLPEPSDATAYAAQIEKVYHAAMSADDARPVAPPVASCACPVRKPAAKRVIRTTAPPSAPLPVVQTAGLIAVPPLPEWALWLATCLFGCMLLAMAFLFGRVTAPLPPPHAPIVIHAAPVPAGPAAPAP
jgi:hypothetical protein